MAAGGVALLLLWTFFTLGQAAISPTAVLSLEEQSRVKQIFYNAAPFSDLATAHYATAGLKTLKAEIPPTQDLCKFIREKVDGNSLESIFYASSISKVITNCQLMINDVERKLSAAIKEGADSLTIFYAATSLSNLGLKVDADSTTKALKTAVNSDEDNILSAANALNVASLFGKEANVDFIFDLIEDIVAQADETEDTYLHFEGGLKPTARFLIAAFRLGEHLSKKPTITEEQVLKFTNYVISRKHVQSVLDSYLLIKVLDVLGNNPFSVPVVVQLYGSPLISEDNTKVKVRVTNVLDKAFGKMTVIAKSAENSEGITVLSNKVFTPGSQDDFIVLHVDLGNSYFAAHSYEVDLMTAQPSAGIYTLTIDVKPQREDKRLIGTTGAKLKVKVVTKVKVEDVEVAIVDKEQSIKAKSVSVQYPTAISEKLEADYHQKVVMTFALRSTSTNELLTPHQAFVRMTNKKTKQEIFFVAEPESNKIFKFDLDIGSSSAKDSFGSLSGQYTMDLIVGDAVIQNPLVWNVGVVALTFAGDPVKSKSADKESLYTAKPPIGHVFRKPEKQPPKAVSTAFTALVLAPLLVMFIAWIKIGANVSNFQFSLGAIVFHLGLGAIFTLFFMFWTHLNMFTTLKILAGIGAVTFLGGNSLLASIANRRSKR